ncbi:unnamed protein product [Amoebophrya sp. A120]|nr:unnamed protein product [Amoebophrya sp. A120]|eukprot:GSA120T00018935001.1
MRTTNEPRISFTLGGGTSEEHGNSRSSRYRAEDDGPIWKAAPPQDVDDSCTIQGGFLQHRTEDKRPDGDTRIQAPVVLPLILGQSDDRASDPGDGGAQDFENCERLQNIATMLSQAVPAVQKSIRHSRSREHRLEEENARLRTALDEAKAEALQLQRILEQERTKHRNDLKEMESMYSVLLDQHERTVDKLQQTQQFTAAPSPGIVVDTASAKGGTHSNHSGSTSPQPQEEP